eukprot:gene9857-51334_t
MPRCWGAARDTALAHRAAARMGGGRLAHPTAARATAQTGA